MIKRTGPAPYKMSDCKFWSAGKCNRGNECTFRHGNDQIEFDNKHVKVIKFEKDTKQKPPVRQIWILKRKPVQE